MLSYRHNAALSCQPLAVLRVLHPASVAQDDATTRFCPRRARFETGQILLRLDAAGPFGPVRVFGSARPRPRLTLRYGCRNRGLLLDQGVWRTTEAHQGRVPPWSSRVKRAIASHLSCLQREGYTVVPSFFNSLRRFEAVGRPREAIAKWLVRSPFLIRGTPRIFLIERSEAPQVEIENQRSVRRQMLH